MSKQLTISATLSILAMVGIAFAAPAMADHNSEHAQTEIGATTISAAAPIFAN